MREREDRWVEEREESLKQATKGNTPTVGAMDRGVEVRGGSGRGRGERERSRVTKSLPKMAAIR